MILKRILKEAVSGYPWNDILTTAKERSADFKAATDKFADAYARRTKSNWDVALILADILERGLYRSYYDDYVKLVDNYVSENGGVANSCYAPVGGIRSVGNPVVLLVWAKENFGISRTQVYSMLEVVDEFTHHDSEKEPGERYSLTAEAREFTFGQLVEMVSIPYKDRLKIKPNWTREMIREYKKALSERGDNKIPPAEQKNPLEPTVPERYQRYSKFSKKDLIDLICSLEDTVEKQKDTIGCYEEKYGIISAHKDSDMAVSYEQLKI